MATKMKGYKLDLAHQTLTLTAAFADAANNPGTAEYKLVCQFQHDFPNLVIVNRTHTTPKRYNNKNGIVTQRNQFSGLNYKRMEKFMNALPEGKKFLDEYNKLKAVADICPSPYAVIRRWFIAQFPKYREDPLFYVNNSVEVIDFAAFLEAAKQSKEAV